MFLNCKKQKFLLKNSLLILTLHLKLLFLKKFELKSKIIIKYFKLRLLSLTIVLFFSLFNLILDKIAFYLNSLILCLYAFYMRIF